MAPFWINFVDTLVFTSYIVHSVIRLEIILGVDDFQANVLLQPWCACDFARIFKDWMYVISVDVLFICLKCIVSNKSCCSSTVVVIESKTLEHLEIWGFLLSISSEWDFSYSQYLLSKWYSTKCITNKKCWTFLN